MTVEQKPQDWNSGSPSLRSFPKLHRPEVIFCSRTVQGGFSPESPGAGVAGEEGMQGRQQTGNRFLVRLSVPMLSAFDRKPRDLFVALMVCSPFSFLAPILLQTQPLCCQAGPSWHRGPASASSLVEAKRRATLAALWAASQAADTAT